MSNSKQILLVGSNATRIEVKGGGWRAAGQYLNETVIPAMAAVAAGYTVVLATPDGTKPRIDPGSDKADHFENEETYLRAKKFWDTDPQMTHVRTLRSVIEEGLDKYAGVFVPGGQAPVVDLMQDHELGEILRHFHAAGKPTALLCHGPIATVAAMPNAREYRAALIAGDAAKATEWAKDWAYAGYKMTVFSDSEEKIVEEHVLKAKVYFTMPFALRTAGGKVSTTVTNFEPNVVIDRELITGQNPRSDRPIAAAFVAALDRVTA